MTQVRSRFASLGNTILLIVLAFEAASCAEAKDGPVVTGLSREKVAVGAELALLGNDFIDAKEGALNVRFEGEFLASRSKAPTAVDFALNLSAKGPDLAVWRRFGAYRVPFGNGLQTGWFRGNVSVTNVPFDEAQPVTSRQLLSTTLGILPSIVMVDARAKGESWVSDCVDPITTAINFVPYFFRFRTIGFDTTEFTYTFGPGIVHGEGVTTSPVQTTQAATENEHALLVQFAPVPENANGFTTTIVVEATDPDGEVHRLEVPIVVRRALQVYFMGKTQMAQLYEPEQVSGCIPGGHEGVNVAYTESHAETRSRTVTETVIEGWQDTYGKAFTDTHATADTEGSQVTETTTTSYTDTRTEAWSTADQTSSSTTETDTTAGHLDFTRSETDSWNWGIHGEESHSFSKEVGLEAGITSTLSGEVGGELGIPGTGVDGKLGGSLSTSLKAQGKLGWVDTESGGWALGGGGSTTEGSSLGFSSSSSTSTTNGSSHTEGYQSGRAQTYSEANSYATTALQSQTRTYSEAVTRSESLAKNMSDSSAIAETVTSTDTTTLDTRGTIPAGQYGVWYRQTTRLVRSGVVVAYDLCGNADVVGEISIDDWTWAPNLAVGDSCAPESDLPPAECRITPCDGQ